MKHFGAALASFGSVALFHMIGVTPEAMRLEDVVPAAASLKTHDVGEADIRTLRASYAKDIGAVDVVVFSAPQLSLVEMQTLAAMLDGRRAEIPLLAVTSPQVKPDCDRMGLTARYRIRRRHGSLRHVLLPELCARNRGSQWLEAPRDQLGQAHQYPRRLRLSAGALVDGAMRAAACAGGTLHER